MTRLERGPGGSYIVYGKDHPPEGTLYQTDWDYPSLAESLGWSIRRVQVDEEGKTVYLKEVRRGHPKVNCRHESTDGTVTCRGCGLTASDFIAGAVDWLDERAF